MGLATSGFGPGIPCLDRGNSAQPAAMSGGTPRRSWFDSLNAAFAEVVVLPGIPCSCAVILGVEEAVAAPGVLSDDVRRGSQERIEADGSVVGRDVTRERVSG